MTKSSDVQVTRHDGVVNLCELEASQNGAEADEARRMYSRALAAIEAAGLASATHQRLMELADLVLDGHLGMLNRMQQGDAMYAHLRGERLWESFYNQRKNAARMLRDAWKALHPPAPHPDGYTAGELKQQAGIKRSTWQKIRAKAGIIVSQGDSSRVFKNAEIRRLADAARSIDTALTRRAADAWDDTLSEWEAFVKTA